MKKVCLYSRTSHSDSNPLNQINELKEVANRNGWTIVKEFVDAGISGAKGRDKRPQFDAMLKSAMKKEYDLVMFWAVDRASRNLTHLVQMMDDLHSKQVGMYFHQQAIDTTTPAGKAMFQMCGVFAEFERGILSERVKAGLNRARIDGKTLGRPIKVANIKAIVEGRNNGKTIRQLSNEHNLSIGKIHNVIKNQ